MPIRFTASFGQSNGSGADNLGHILCDGRSTYLGSSAEPLCQVWNNEPFATYDSTDTSSGLGSAFVLPVKGAAPFVGNPSSGGLRTVGNNNPGIHFANYLSRALGDRIRHFHLCRGSTTIKRWIETNGTRQPLYTKSAAIFDAAAAAIGQPVILTAVTVHFGEGDNGAGEVEHFKARLLALRAALIADGYADTSTLFVCAQPASVYAASTAALSELAAQDANFVVARNNHLAADETDHFRGDQLIYIGRACYEALIASPWKAASLGLPHMPTPLHYTVMARGFFDQVDAFPCDTWVQVPVIGDTGICEMVDAGGWLRIPFGGLWQFDARYWVGNAHGLEARLETSSGSLYANLGGDRIPDATQNAQRKFYSRRQFCGTGDTVALAVRHQRPATLSMKADDAYNEISLVASFVGGC